MIPPVKVNDLIEVNIEKLVHGGEGLAKLNDFAIFVPQGIPGDILEVRVISVKKGYSRGLINKIISPSDLRINPPCPVTIECGGCQWQELEYQEQLKTKEILLIENLQKIGNISKENIEKSKIDIIGMTDPFYYRNKAQFPFSVSKNNIKGGFYSAKSHNIVEIEKCYIQEENINKIFLTIKKLLIKYDISIYNEKTNSGFFKHLIVRNTNSNNSLIGFVTTSQENNNLKHLIHDLISEIPDITGIIRNINDKKTNTILGKENILLYGKDHIIESLKDIKYKISLKSFFQINSTQVIHLYNSVLKFANLKGDENILDAYAGTGSIALWLSKFSKKVIGIEIVESAVKDSIENASLNNITNVDFRLGKVEELINNVIKENRIDILILDPPRKGCEESIFSEIEESGINKVIYVSCNPATLARDSNILISKGFNLIKFQPVDMFPHTYHLETVALFEKS